MKVNLFKKWSHKGCTIWYPEAGGMEVKKKKKNFAAKGSEEKKINPTPKSGGEMVIFE